MSDSHQPAILITGCSSGIGHATAERFAARGWRVFATMRRPESSGGALRDEAARQGWRLTTPALDVTRDDSVAAAVAGALGETGGRLDVLVNNAGYYALGPLEETTPDELRAQLETNVVGVHRVTRAVLPAMRERGSGTIVTLGSVSGRVAVPIVGAYHASKWALEGLTDSLAQEVTGFGIKVTLVEPGAFSTEWAGPSAAHSAPLAAYDGVREAVAAGFSGIKLGDPAGVGPALLKVVDAENPPLRVFFGTFQLPLIHQAYTERLKTWDDWAAVSAEAEGVQG